MKKTITVIGGLILAPAIAGLLVNWFTPINVLGLLRSIGSNIYFCLTSPIYLPFWALVILAFVWPILRFGATLCTVLKKAGDCQAKLLFLKYTADSFFDIDWIWAYSGRAIDDQSITARCPHCKCLLDWVRTSSYNIVDFVSLVCPHCGHRKTFERNERDLLRLVHRHIDRKIVTGEFISTVQQPARGE